MDKFQHDQIPEAWLQMAGETGDMAELMNLVRFGGNQRRTEPTGLEEEVMDYLGCECRFFPAMDNDGPIREAYDQAWQRGQKEGFVPVLLMVDDMLWECLQSGVQGEQDDPWDLSVTPEQVEAFRREVLAEPVADGQEALRQMGAWDDQEEWCEDEAEDLDLSPAEASKEPEAGFASYWGFGNSTRPLLMALVPVRQPWEIFAYLPIGGWNECPDTRTLMAVAKYWYQEYGAVPAVMSHDILEFALPEPVPAEKIPQLVQEQCAFCPACQDIALLARELTRSIRWFFWWD